MQSVESPYYQKAKVITFPIIVGIIIFCISTYLLKPTEIQIAEFYISQSEYDRALKYFYRILEKENDRTIRWNILEKIARIYRITAQFEAFENTVKKYYQEGGRNSALLKDALDIALLLWRRKPTSLKTQKRVIFWAKVLKKRDFLKEFYVWNGYFKDFLMLCEEDWKNGNLHLKDIEKSIKVARWIGKEDIRILWLKRYLMAGGKKEEFKKELIELYLAKREYKDAISLLKKSAFPTKELLLAQAYAGIGEKEKSAKLYYRLYKKTKNIRFLENAYFLLTEVSPDKAKRLLPLLKTYKPEYALALASTELKRGNKKEALKLYLFAWERWHNFSSLKMAYALSFHLKKEWLCLRLIKEMFAWLKRW